MTAQIQSTTGATQHEPPPAPALRIDTAGCSVEDAVDELISLLEKENLL